MRAMARALSQKTGAGVATHAGRACGRSVGPWRGFPGRSVCWSTLAVQGFRMPLFGGVSAGGQRAATAPLASIHFPHCEKLPTVGPLCARAASCTPPGSPASWCSSAVFAIAAVLVRSRRVNMAVVLGAGCWVLGTQPSPVWPMAFGRCGIGFHQRFAAAACTHKRYSPASPAIALRSPVNRQCVGFEL